MGIYSRDYIRDSNNSAGLWSDTPTCRMIVIATVVVFLAQLLFLRAVDTRREGVENGVQGAEVESLPPQYRAKYSVVEEWLSLDTNKVLRGQVWRVATTALLHNRHGLWHILVNMVVLIWLGRSLELNYGSREFLLFYIFAAIFGSLAFISIQLITGDRTPAIGASGAVMAVFCLFALWNPGYTVNVYMVFPIPIIWLLGLYVIYDLHPLVLQLTGSGWRTGIAHAAHLGGVAFGFFYYRQSWKLEPLVDRITPEAFKSVQRPRVVRPTVQQSAKVDRQDQEVDEILAKISREGEASLTERERKVLLDASQRYQKRR
jgi:membrane associated rhomboid family serine protease